MAVPVVSIIVPTLGRPQALDACLCSIRDTVHIEHEVIAVPVAGDNATCTVLSHHSWVRVEQQPMRGGCVQAMNMGGRAARGRYLLHINDDCQLLPHSVANAIRFLEAPVHANVGQAAFFHNSPVRRNIFQQITLDGEWFHVGHVRGLCYANFGLATRALHESLGYFDERYFMYGADPDFSLKVWHRAGLSVMPCPGALIRHLELNDERAAVERAAQVEDNRRLFAKWNLGDGTVAAT